MILQIRALTSDDLACVSTLCMDAFTQAVAPSLSAQGIETFTRIASIQALADRMHTDNVMLVCAVDGVVVGLVELKEGRHVAMLFIAPSWQRRGIGKCLIDAALKHARVDVVTVSASLSSVPAYTRYGFALAGEVSEFAGLTYQPMQRMDSL